MTPSDSLYLSSPSDELHFTVARLDCRLRIPDNHPDPLGIRDRMARLAEQELSAALADSLSALATDDQAVYRIRQLSLNVWVDMQGMSTAEMSQRWSQALAKAASRTIQEFDSSQMVRFETPRHYITAFLRDLLDGRAWNCWYYDEFRNLQRLSIAEIATLLLARHPDWIALILLELETSGHTLRLIESLDKLQIERLWAALGLPLEPDPYGPVSDLDWLAGLWQGIPLSGANGDNARARDRLRLWLGVARADSARACDPRLGGWLVAMADLNSWRHNLADGSFTGRAGWLTALSQSESGRLALIKLAQTVGLHAGQAQRQTLLASAVGSIFLLLPAIVESRLWEIWTATEGEQTARHYLYLLALKALGHSRAPSSQYDPILAAFAGLEKAPPVDSGEPLQPYRAEISWARALFDLGRRWFSITEASLSVVRLAPEIELDELEVLRDPEMAVWLAASRFKGNHSLDLQNTWDLWFRRDDPTPQEMESFQAEARHFQLGQSLGYAWLTPSLDAALSVATSIVLRRLAGSLLGMQRASPAYLAHQFLAQPADLQRSSVSWRLQCSGGPLRVVLQISSLPEKVEAPWLPAPVTFSLGSSGPSRS